MSHAYSIPVANEPAPVAADEVVMVASGDLRHSANAQGWPAQQKPGGDSRPRSTSSASRLRTRPRRTTRRPATASSRQPARWAWTSSRPSDPTRRVIVAEAVWQYSHHVLAGLQGQRGPILTAANWSGQWPGLVGMLNLNASLTKAGIAYSPSGARTSPTTSRAAPSRNGRHRDHRARHLARA